MLDLRPLIARLVEDILRAIGEATLAELDATREAAKAPRARTAPTRVRRVRRAGARAPKPSVHVGSPSRARAANKRAATDSKGPELHGVDDITDPEELLAPMPLPVAIEPSLSVPRASESTPRSEPEAETPPSPAQPVSHYGAFLRAGESVARASAAGVVIRRARRA
jgi:hypothetical protein